MNESIDPVHKPDLKDSFTKKWREPAYLMTEFKFLREKTFHSKEV